MLTRRRLLDAALRASLLALLLVASAALGCAEPTLMAPVDAPRAGLNRTPDAATVVFINPARLGGNGSILDGTGRFLGQSLPSSYFAVKVSPGYHVFVTCGSTSVIQATVDADKVYFVWVRPLHWSPNVVLVPVTKGSAQWQKVDEWLADKQAYVPDDARVHAYWNERAGERNECIAAARAQQNLPPVARRMLAPSDGR